MPRLVATGSSGKWKVWHAWVEGTSLHVHFGKLFRRGESQTKSFTTRAAAERELAKLVKQKLASGYTDHAQRLVFAPGRIVLHELVDPPLPEPEDSADACESVEMNEGSCADAFWHGDYTFALERERGTWVCGLIDRSGRKPRWRPFEPRLTGDDFPNGFASSNDRCITSTPSGPAYVIDCKTLASELVAAAGDEIVSAALTRDYAALLRKNKKTRLELYAKRGRQWSLAYTIACHDQNALAPFAGGRGLVVGWVQVDGAIGPKTHFLKVDGEPRLLGTCTFAHRWVFERDGRSFFQETSAVYEIGGFEDACARIAKKNPLEKLA